MEIKTALMVFLGGGFGAMGRVWLDLRLKTAWPDLLGVGVLTVNMLGCLAIGYAFTALEEGAMKTAILGGLLGGLTTYSGFALMLEAGARDGRWAAVAVQIVTHLALGLAVVSLGAVVAQHVSGLPSTR